jgi:hypothetical protein
MTTDDVERSVALAEQFRNELYRSDSAIWMSRVELDNLGI